MTEKEMFNILYVNGMIEKYYNLSLLKQWIDNGATFRVTQGELDVVQPNTKKIVVRGNCSQYGT